MPDLQSCLGKQIVEEEGKEKNVHRKNAQGKANADEKIKRQ